MIRLNLTDARRAIIQETLDEYRAVGLSTEPADYDAAEAAVTSLYASIDLPKPYFVRLSSPLAAELYINLLTAAWPKQYNKNQLGGQLGDQLWSQLGDQLWSQLRDQLRGQLRDQLWDQLGDQLWSQLGGQLGDQLRDQLRGQLRDQLWDQLWSQLRGQLWDQLRDQLGDQLRDQLGGQSIKYTGTWFTGSWDYYWMYMDGARRVGVRLPKTLNQQLSDHIMICRSVGWWYPFKEFCILADRPERIALDEQGRPHCETGLSIQFRDGAGFSAWHGTRAPDEWFTGKLPGARSALKWENLEQRRVACEMIGWHHILDQLGARTIHTDDDPEIGELVEVDIPDVGRERFLRVRCGTGRDFALAVPPDMRTALEANAWTWGLDGQDYQPEIRT